MADTRQGIAQIFIAFMIGAIMSLILNGLYLEHQSHSLRQQLSHYEKFATSATSVSADTLTSPSSTEGCGK